MKTFVKALVMSAVMGLGGVAAVPALAQDGGVYLEFGGRDGPRVGVDGRSRYRDRWDERSCSASDAVRKASRMGIRNARVVDTDRRTIEVAGRRHGDRVYVTFGRRGDCPVVRW
ncbi:MAG: hypothetical protein ABTQ31_18140 [Rhizobiaceae bacterium]